MVNESKSLQQILADLNKQRISCNERGLEAQKSLSELKSRIIKGESTGNLIKDFTIINFDVNSRIEDVLQTIASQVRSHVGELILFDYRYTDAEYYGKPNTHYMISPYKYTHHGKIMLGIIASPELSLYSPSKLSEKEMRDSAVNGNYELLKPHFSIAVSPHINWTPVCSDIFSIFILKLPEIKKEGIIDVNAETFVYKTTNERPNRLESFLSLENNITRTINAYALYIGDTQVNAFFISTAGENLDSNYSENFERACKLLKDKKYLSD